MNKELIIKILKDEKIKNIIKEKMRWLVVRATERSNYTSYTRSLFVKYYQPNNYNWYYQNTYVDNQLLFNDRLRHCGVDSLIIDSSTVDMVCQCELPFDIFIKFYKQYQHLFIKTSMVEDLLSSEQFDAIPLVLEQTTPIKLSFDFQMEHYWNFKIREYCYKLNGQEIDYKSDYMLLLLHTDKKAEEIVLKNIDTLSNLRSMLVHYFEHHQYAYDSDSTKDWEWSSSRRLLWETVDRVFKPASLEKVYDDSRLADVPDYPMFLLECTIVYAKLMGVYYEKGSPRVMEAIVSLSPQSLGLIDYLLEIEDDIYISHHIFDLVCEVGTLDQVVHAHKSILSSTPGGIKASTRAMDRASQHGSLEIVEFLLENRTEQCTPVAIISNTHTEVVLYLLKHKPMLSSYLSVQNLLEVADLRLLQAASTLWETYPVDDQHRNNKPPVISRWIVETILKTLWEPQACDMIDYLVSHYPTEFPVYHFFSEACMNGLLQVVKTLHRHYPTSTSTPSHLKTTIFDDAYLYGVNDELVEFLIDNRQEGFSVETWKTLGECGSIKEFNMLYRSISSDMDILKVWQTILSSAIQFNNLVIINHIKTMTKIDTVSYFTVENLKQSSRNFSKQVIEMALEHLSLNDRTELFYYSLTVDRVFAAELYYLPTMQLTNNQINFLISQYNVLVINFIIAKKMLTQEFVDQDQFFLCHSKMHDNNITHLGLSNINVRQGHVRSHKHLKLSRLRKKEKKERELEKQKEKQLLTIGRCSVDGGGGGDSKEYLEKKRNVIGQVLRNRYLFKKILRLTILNLQVSEYKQNTIGSLHRYRPKLLRYKLERKLPIDVNPSDLEIFCSSRQLDPNIFNMVYEQYRDKFIHDNLLRSITNSENFEVIKTLVAQKEPVELKIAYPPDKASCGFVTRLLFDHGKITATCGDFGRRYLGLPGTQPLSKEEFMVVKLAVAESCNLYDASERSMICNGTRHFHEDHLQLHYSTMNLVMPDPTSKYSLTSQNLWQKLSNSTDGIFGKVPPKYKSQLGNYGIKSFFHLVPNAHKVILKEVKLLASVQQDTYQYLIDEHGFAKKELLDLRFSLGLGYSTLKSFYLQGIFSEVDVLSEYFETDRKSQIRMFIYMGLKPEVIVNHVTTYSAVKKSACLALLLSHTTHPVARDHIISKFTPTVYTPAPLLRLIIDHFLTNASMSQANDDLPFGLRDLFGEAHQYTEAAMAISRFDLVGTLEYLVTRANELHVSVNSSLMYKVFLYGILTSALKSCKLDTIRKIEQRVPELEKVLCSLARDAILGSNLTMEYRTISNLDVYSYYYNLYPSLDLQFLTQCQKLDHYNVIKQHHMNRSHKIEPNGSSSYDLSFLVYVGHSAITKGREEIFNAVQIDCQNMDVSIKKIIEKHNIVISPPSLTYYVPRFTEDSFRFFLESFEVVSFDQLIKLIDNCRSIPKQSIKFILEEFRNKNNK